jgi:hypothetical protein
MPRFAGKLLDLVFLALIRIAESVMMSGLTFIVCQLRGTSKLVHIWLAGMNLS